MKKPAFIFAQEVDQQIDALGKDEYLLKSGRSKKKKHEIYESR